LGKLLPREEFLGVVVVLVARNKSLRVDLIQR